MTNASHIDPGRTMHTASSVDPSRKVALRPAGAADDGFLRRLFLEARPELQGLPRDIVDMQIKAQRLQYQRDHPESVDEIIELDAERLGRCWTADTEHELHLLDLAVRTDRRRQGISTAVLTTLIHRAAERNVPIRLAVWASNVGARALYAAVGFTDLRLTNGYALMGLSPGGRT